MKFIKCNTGKEEYSYHKLCDNGKINSCYIGFDNGFNVYQINTYKNLVKFEDLENRGFINVDIETIQKTIDYIYKIGCYWKEAYQDDGISIIKGLKIIEKPTIEELFGDDIYE